MISSRRSWIDEWGVRDLLSEDADDLVDVVDDDDWLLLEVDAAIDFLIFPELSFKYERKSPVEQYSSRMENWKEWHNCDRWYV